MQETLEKAAEALEKILEEEDDETMNQTVKREPGRPEIKSIKP